ncbi:MAG: restriction endonuclease, partial [Patescibacteria group bacterium]
MLITKASGAKELFDPQKLLSSIRRAGVPLSLQSEALSHVQNILYSGITTSEIYSHITEFLANSKYPYTKSSYSLKRAIMELGPTGYPFEDYVAEILKIQGYKTKTRSLLTGKCVTHEVDIIAEKESEKIFVECKFHNNPGNHCNVHVPLYTKARFDDLKERYSLTQSMLVTNTKITPDGLAYALCENIRVLSWNFPEGESLRDIIEKEKLYPLTQLHKISLSQKQSLFQNHVVLCEDVV